VVAALFLSSALLYADDTLRVRIAWGGGAERLWEGTIAVSQGTLSEPRLLGIEADEPGSMWLDGGQLTVRQRTPRAYDGVDVLVTAPMDAKLLVQLTADDDKQRGAQIEVPLADISNEFRNLQLDQRDNHLLVRRTPGDQLRVTMPRDALVFAPGETMTLEVEPHLLPLGGENKLRMKVQLLAEGQRELWSAHRDMRTSQLDAIPLQIPLPDDEGVYDVVVSVLPGSAWPHPVRPALNWKKSIAERRVQAVVLSRERPRMPAKPDASLTQVMEIDPASARWWEKVKLPNLSTLPRLTRSRGPLGNGCLQTVRHALGEVAQLSPSASSPDLSWEAYSLTISRPGRPHVLEVDYPSDVPQTMGVSILEPNAAGALVPIGLDSGIDVGETLAAAAPRWARHRVVFWPRTAAPLLLITNHRANAPAMYGKIRVLAGWDHLPRLVGPISNRPGDVVPMSNRPGTEGRLDKPSAPPRPPEGTSFGAGRQLLAYLDRPLFPENFLAGESLDAWSGRSLDSWGTFYEGGRRLVEYLHYAGYSGLMISALVDGSTIYPSKLLEPTPRYDTGAFFATAQDPVRKDVLEMLFRMFDREQLQLVPSIEFAAPLPQLEAVRRRGGAEAQGIEWIGPDGASWCQSYALRRGLAPYYNTLDPRVQQAMLDVVREIVERYGRHAAMAGLGLRLSAYGYAQLPGPDWGMDDATIARFEQATGLNVPGQGPSRFGDRAAFLNGPEHRRKWIEWRAAQLQRFYGEARRILVAACPQARLYLAGAELWTGPELEAELRPMLPRKTTLAESLLHAGIDLRSFQQDPRMVLLRPERVLPSQRLSAKAVDLEVAQMPEVDLFFRGLPQPASLFFHPPQEVRIPSFDQKGPFKPSYAWLITQPVPAGVEGRQRFVHSLATMDSQLFVDGGWLLPLGQEDALGSLAAAYRRLPAVPFAALADSPGGGGQPAMFRHVTLGDRTYAYAVNDAPFAATLQVQVEASADCRMQELSGSRRIAPLRRESAGTTWTLELEPYDLLAVQFSEPGVKFSDARVSLPETVAGALGQRIRQLGVRATALRSPSPLPLVDNPGFERPATASEPVPGWLVSRRLGVRLQTEKADAHGGKQSARIASDGPVACLVSRPFDAPRTGRLSMSVWLRLADAGRQPNFRLAVEGKIDGRDYYRFAAVGQAPGAGQPAVPIGAAWGQFIFQIDDLPLEGLSPLRVRLDLMGQGDVWVDDVQLYDLAFSETELRALYKLITLANVTLQNGQVGDCLRLLEGYWPQFLAQNVPLGPATPPAAEVAERPADARQPAAATQPTGLMDRVKKMLPDRLRY
jgi:hypothetical protein